MRVCDEFDLYVLPLQYFLFLICFLLLWWFLLLLCDGFLFCQVCNIRRPCNEGLVEEAICGWLVCCFLLWLCVSLTLTYFACVLILVFPCNLGEVNLCEKSFYLGAIAYFHFMSIESTFTCRQNCMLIIGYTPLLK